MSGTPVAARCSSDIDAEHYALQTLRTHNYEASVRKKLEERLNPSYPPHVRLANVIVSSPDDDDAADQASEAVRWVKRGLARPGSPRSTW